MRVRITMTVAIPDNWYKGKISDKRMREIVKEEFLSAQNHVLSNVLETVNEEGKY